jgi:SAM-dependent methyltransferase
MVSQIVLATAASLPPGRALDLACGTGRNAIWLAERGWSVVGIDRVVENLPPEIDARVMDLETGAPLPFADESFDLVLIILFLHRPLFAEAKRVLRRGGTLITTAKTSGRFAVAAGELRTHFEEWTIVHDRIHDVAELVAIKP